jgi:colanic acid/amylovoran biosynthesis protein
MFVQLPRADPKTDTTNARRVPALKRLTKRLSGSAAFFYAYWFLAMAIARVTRCKLAGRGTQPSHWLICPPGGGNIGDQALFEAAAAAIPGPIVAVVREEGSLTVPTFLAGKVSFLEMPSLLYGHPVSQLRELRALLRRSNEMKSLSVIGADVMDGNYRAAASVLRWIVAERVAVRGVPVRVLGFSWNRKTAASATAAMRRASRNVRVFARDPVSAERLGAAGCRQVHLAADVVFGLPTVGGTIALEDYFDSQDLGANGLALVNASGLVGRELQQIPEYVYLVTKLREAGFMVLLLPHVVRPGGDDLPECRAVASAFATDPGVGLVESLLAPQDVKALAAQARIIITGRMHLGVLGLSVGVPAVIVATQGKVEGLVALSEGHICLVEPVSGFGRSMVDLSAALVDMQGGDQVATRLRALAHQNFQDLPSLPLPDGPASIDS